MKNLDSEEKGDVKEVGLGGTNIMMNQVIQISGDIHSIIFPISLVSYPPKASIS